VLFSLYNGFCFGLKNRKARPIAYVKNNGGANSLGFQGISGSVILAF
jgi:succinate dehydrogenase / fumarate reductase cytochrome b subunit